MPAAQRGPTEWVVARRLMPTFVAEKGQTYRPHAILVVEPAHGLVAGVQAVHPDTTADEVADWAASLIRRLPRGGELVGVRTDDPALARSLSRALGAGYAAVADAIPEAEAPFTSLAMTLMQSGSEGPVLEDASVETVGRFFAAAERVFRQAPWRFVADGEPLALHAPGLGYPDGCLCVIGAAGESLGALVYGSLADYLHVLGLADRPAGRTSGPGVRIFSLNYDPATKVRPAWRRLAREQKWPVPRGGFPRVLIVEPDALLQPLTDRDYEVGTAILEALHEFVQEHGRAFGKPMPTVVSTRTGGVVITAPHPQASWQWGVEHPFDVAQRGRKRQRRRQRG